ncbi:MAG: hypothetical protein IT229_02635 [Flavobacteriales bacterium]|nr:hypothetical protein [Flavobacteriales bacterium]
MSLNPLRTFALRHPWAVILSAVLVTYWPLSTFGWTLTYGDTLDCWLPWRFFIATCLQDGHFPLWNPMQQMGYPIYADLQGPAWYVEAIALGGTIGQSILVLQGLFLAYLVIGGLGMRRLVLEVHGHEGAALVIGLAYALGGFFTGHTMHFYSVISAAWLPWLIEAQLRLMRVPNWRPALSAAVFQYFLLSGGNHTFTILVAYLLVGLFMVRTVGLWQSGGRAVLGRLLAWEGVYVLLTMLMACGTLYAAWEVAPYLSRAEGLGYADAAVRPFTWRACLSYLFPFAVGVDAEALGTDPTMANGYLGMLVGLFALLTFFRKITVIEKVLIVFGSICLLASFGAAMPVHNLLWSVLPGFDLFRFPSYFQWGVQLAVLVLAGGTLAQWSRIQQAHGSPVKLILVGLTCLVAALWVWAWMRVDGRPIDAGIYEKLKALTTAQRVVLSGTVPLLLLFAAVLLAHRRMLGLTALGNLVLLEMTWSTGLALWNTSVADVSPFVVKARVDAQPDGPIVPHLEPLGSSKDDGASLHYLWRNTQVYKGQPTRAGFNSFQLKHVLELDAAPDTLAVLDRRPLIFLENSEPSDRLELRSFEHDRFVVHVRNKAADQLVVQQAWYPGWRIRVDGKDVPLIRLHMAAFGCAMPAGDHLVEVLFRKPIVPWLLGLSMVTLFAVLLLLALTGPWPWMRYFCLLILGGAIVFALLGHRPRSERIELGLRDLAGTKATGRVVSTDRPALVQAVMPGALALLRCQDASQLPLVLTALEATEGPHAELIEVGLDLPLETAYLLNDQGWHVTAREQHAGVMRWKLTRQARGGEGHQVFRDGLGGGRALTGPDDPYTTAFRVRVGDLDYAEGALMAMDLQYRARPGAHGMVVLERKRNGKVTNYEAIPFVAADVSDSAWTPVLLCRSRKELRDPEEELGIYVWNDAADTLWVKDLRVRMLKCDD